jgi:hypothetical protein
MIAIGVAGCSENFSDKLQKRRYCVDQSGILPAKVDTCSSNTNGSRDDFARCLHDQLVPQRKINSLYSCVESSGHY